MIANCPLRTTRRRGAWSLIEALAVMSTMFGILTVAAGLVHLLLRVEGRGRLEVAAAEGEGRLALDLRSDVHAADDARIEPAEAEEDADDDRLALAGPDGEAITYRREGGGLLREAERDGERLRVERYRLPEGSASRWAIDEVGGRTVVTLELERGGDRGPGARIVAVLGRDHRFDADRGPSR